MLLKLSEVRFCMMFFSKTCIFLEKFHTTSQLISAIKNNAIPSKILITTHPQRWSNNLIEWCIEYCSQNLKNLIKRLLIKQ